MGDVTRARPVAAMAVVGLSLGLAVPVLIMSGATALFIDAWAVQFLCASISGVALAGVLTAAVPQPMQLAFWTFSYVWLGIAPLAMLTRDAYPLEVRVDSETSFAASVIVLTGMLAYLGASMLTATAISGAEMRGPRKDGSSGRLMEFLTHRRLTWPRVVGLAVFSLLIAVVLIPRLGGFAGFFESRQAASEATNEATAGSSGKAEGALLGWGLSVPTFWALYGLLHVRLSREQVNERLIRWVLLIAIIGANVIANNPISQPRFWAGTVLLGLAFGSRWFTDIRVFRAGGALLLFGLVVLFPLADYFRYEEPQVSTAGPLDQLVTNGDYDAYQQIQSGVLMVEDAGIQPAAALGPPLFWVPRAVWPDKPEDTGVVIGRFVGYQFLNLSSPLWVEAYYWGGTMVVIGVFVGLGAFSRRADHAFHRHRYDRTHLASVLIPPLAFYQIIVLRGSLLQAMAALALLLVTPLLITRHIPGSPRVTGADSRTPGQAQFSPSSTDEIQARSEARVPTDLVEGGYPA